MVLAAGAGRRLRPHTDSLPKALIPVDGETTILDIALRNLAGVGLRDVAIVVGFAASAVADRKSALERRHGVSLTLVHNEKAEIWNNAYSMWLACDVMSDGALVVNGDTVHPLSVEETLLSARDGAGIVLAVDTTKRLAAEEMKVCLDAEGRLSRITKLVDPASASGEYIGASLVAAHAVPALAKALQDTWESNPDDYYEDGYQRLVDEQGTTFALAGLDPSTRWVEVDNCDDLVAAREIACRY
ncbi:MAG: sugar phosphate nucleotidyltransferase [Nocardioidaceae bacterium]